MLLNLDGIHHYSPLSPCQEEPLLLVKLAPLYSNMVHLHLSNKTTMGDRRLDLFPLKARWTQESHMAIHLKGLRTPPPPWLSPIRHLGARRLLHLVILLPLLHLRLLCPRKLNRCGRSERTYGQSNFFFGVGSVVHGTRFHIMYDCLYRKLRYRNRSPFAMDATRCMYSVADAPLAILLQNNEVIHALMKTLCCRGLTNSFFSVIVP